MKKIQMLFLIVMMNNLAFAGGLGGSGTTAGGLGGIGTTLTAIQTAFLAFGVTIATLAFMYVGFKMMFRSATWEDVSSVFVGAMMVSGASILAGLLFG